MSDLSLGLDLSDSPTRVVVVNNTGQVLSRGETSQPAAAAGGKIGSVGVAVPQAAEAVPPEVLAALGEAVPGSAPLATPCGTAAAIAEQWCGAARGLLNVVTFAIAEHVTGGIVLSGEPWHGANGYAASIGWLALNPVEREDYRRLGGLEAEVAAAGIVRRLVWRIKSGDRSSVADLAGGDLQRVTADHVFTAARQGDGVCISVVRDTAKYVGMAVANVATMVNPEAIVLGGVIASSGDMMLEAIRVECSRRLRPAQFDRLRIVLSTLGADEVAIGAARAAAKTRA
jgi:glucokinase